MAGGPSAEAGRAGGEAVERVRRAIAGKPGWEIAGEEITVRNAAGKARRYDLVARSPSGRLVGIEIKSGKAIRTLSQRLFDQALNAQRGGLRIVGRKPDDIRGQEILRALVIHVQ